MNVEKVWGAHYTLGARYLSKNTVFNRITSIERPEKDGSEELETEGAREETMVRNN
jgi:hypothetical protein